jgi:hypothetical protein
MCGECVSGLHFDMLSHRIRLILFLKANYVTQDTPRNRAGTTTGTGCQFKRFSLVYDTACHPIIHAA